MNVSIQSPFPDYAVPRLWAWAQEFRKAVADDFGPQTLAQFMEEWARRSVTGKTWAVERDGEIGGVIVFEPLTPAVGTIHVMFAKRFWGSDTTIAAIRAALVEIFAGGWHKVSVCVFAHNSQVLKLAKELGARREGTLREHTVQDGKPVDMVMLGLLKTEFKPEDACHSPQQFR